MSQVSNAYMSTSNGSEQARSRPADNFNNMGSPRYSMSDYARTMHEHTKHQLSTATDSARRRSQDSGSSSSSFSSVRSTDS